MISLSCLEVTTPDVYYGSLMLFMIIVHAHVCVSLSTATE